jgi:hypothetical protein
MFNFGDRPGLFLTERAGTPLRNFFLRRTQAGTALRNFFSSIDVTNTSPTATEFLVTMRSGNYFLYKNITEIDVHATVKWGNIHLPAMTDTQRIIHRSCDRRVM